MQTNWTHQSKGTEWLDELKKQDPTICCLKTLISAIKTYTGSKWMGYKMILQANGNQKKMGVAILRTDWSQAKNDNKR